MTAAVSVGATAYERVLDQLRGSGSHIRETRGGQAMAQCPAHDDRTASLSIRRLPGRATLHCFTGCDDEDVLAVLGLTVADLFDAPRGGREVVKVTPMGVKHPQTEKTWRPAVETRVQAALRHLMDDPRTGLQLCRRIAQQTILEADPEYWVRQATAFDQARPRPGDFTGSATPEDLAALEQRCREMRDACLERAEQVSDVA